VNRRKGVAKPDEQGRAFIAKARELGCDEDPEAFERVFARVVPPRKPLEGRPKKELPRDEWTLHQEAPDSVIVGAWEHPPGYRWYEKFQLSDLPNEFVGLEDLKRLGVDLNHCGTIAKHEPLEAPGD
jgi:hypothetical protein